MHTRFAILFVTGRPGIEDTLVLSNRLIVNLRCQDLCFTRKGRWRAGASYFFGLCLTSAQAEH